MKDVNGDKYRPSCQKKMGYKDFPVGMLVLAYPWKGCTYSGPPIKGKVVQPTMEEADMWGLPPMQKGSPAVWVEMDGNPPRGTKKRGIVLPENLVPMEPVAGIMVLEGAD